MSDTMTKGQFYDVLMNPDNYTGCEITVCAGYPFGRTGKIFYTTPDSIVYEYTDYFDNIRYDTITKDNYILCQFKHLQARKKVI